MPRRQPLTQVLRAALAALFTAALCTGCAQLHVDVYPTTQGSQERCEELLHDLPGSVDGHPVRFVQDAVAGAWGEPPIILRCGVQVTPDAVCREVAGETWRVSTTADGRLLTSLDRPVRVSVEVPSDYRPADVVPDIVPALDKHDPIKASVAPTACR